MTDDKRECVHAWCWRFNEVEEYLGNYPEDAEEYDDEEVTVAFWRVVR